MTEIKTYIVTLAGALFTLLAPIHNFMYAMVLLFSLNFLFGLIAAWAKGEGWKTKKALMFLLHTSIFFIAAAAIFVIGNLMNEATQSVVVVKMLCFAALWIFGTNILRNWRTILTPGTPWYKLVDLLYYVFSVKFIERFPIIKKWQQERETKIANDNGPATVD